MKTQDKSHQYFRSKTVQRSKMDSTTTCAVLPASYNGEVFLAEQLAFI